jgi:hypothetical protein
MNRRTKQDRKAYSMERMIAAIERAILADTSAEAEKASRWASAWGVLSGIRSPGVRLRRSVLSDGRRERRAVPRHP